MRLPVLPLLLRDLLPVRLPVLPLPLRDLLPVRLIVLPLLLRDLLPVRLIVLPLLLRELLPVRLPVLPLLLRDLLPVRLPVLPLLLRDAAGPLIHGVQLRRPITAAAVGQLVRGHRSRLQLGVDPRQLLQLLRRKKRPAHGSRPFFSAFARA